MAVQNGNTREYTITTELPALPTQTDPNLDKLLVDLSTQSLSVGVDGARFDMAADKLWVDSSGPPTTGDQTAMDSVVSGHDGSFAGPPQMEGSGFEDSSSMDTSSTTSGSYTPKLTHSTATLAPAGKYRIEWSYEVRNSRRSKSVKSRIVVDGSVVADGTIRPGSRHDWYMQSGHTYVTGLSGSVDIAVEFAKSDGGTAHMRRARVALWRVT